MTEAIKRIIASQGYLVCPVCKGEGEVGYFCGHETTTNCYHCDGNGVVKSLKKQKHREECRICQGTGGPGCCDNKGYHEWESFELI